MRRMLGTTRMDRHTFEGMAAEMTTEPEWASVSAKRAAISALQTVCDTYLADLEKLKHRLATGGTYLEMRATVDAYQVIDENTRGITKAIDQLKEAETTHD